MRDLGTLDYASLALGINDGGDVVGASLDTSFNPRALLWEKGVMTDLNTRIAANPAGLYLLVAVSINSRGEIVGLAVTSTGLHGFLATPVH
jgi:probable HAF family extracellular repeat protein